MKRTKEQGQANELDRQLHNCLLGTSAMPFLPWTVAYEIRKLRNVVRGHMHPTDRKRTEGS